MLINTYIVTMTMRMTHFTFTFITVGVMLGFAQMPAYGDHVDKHIWIETAEGSFITATDKALDKIDDVYYERTDNFYYDTTNPKRIAWITHTVLDVLEEREFTSGQKVKFGEPQTTRINGIQVIDQRRGECGDKTSEVEYFKSLADPSKSINYFPDSLHRYKYFAFEIEPDEQQKHHENVCGYWYTNTLKDEYTYTIIDLPRDRIIPEGYKEKVRTGVQAGLDRWGDINNIDFSYTDNRLAADIIIQQQIGDTTQYGNADISCLFDNKQCTIQLFTDLNINGQQTLVSTLSIDWTIAHEFGHLIGLPHHIEPDNIMNTIHDNNIRTYYEVGGINIPNMKEPTIHQRLLPNDTIYTIVEIMSNEKTIEFIEYIESITQNMSHEGIYTLLYNIVAEITNKLTN